MFLTVKHGKAEFQLEATEATTLDEVAATLRERAGLMGGDLRLICAGKTLYGGTASAGAGATTVGQLPKGLQTKLLMMGATKVEIENMQTCPPCSQTRRVINDLAPPSSGAPPSAASAERPAAPSEFRFYDIVPLPGLPDEARARAILTELANDVGILAVMKKHRWKVGQLAEMYPEGLVGVDPVCVLGLNVNKGMRIQLRLRTDDMEGFRKLSSIKKVLYHELAHNVHSEHDSDFYQLMRQVEAEANALDWRKSAAHAVGGGAPPPPTAAPSTSASTNTGAGGSAAAPTGGRRLGGDSEANGLTSVFTARTLAGLAAVMRLTEEEKEVEQGCGCAQRARGPAHAPPAAAPAAEAKAEADEAGPPLKDGHGPQGQQS